MSAKFSKLAAIGLSLALAGCFQPLHGPQFGAIGGKLANVQVEPIEGHLGHYLKAELDFALNNGTPPTAPQYRLTAKPVGNPGAIIVDALSGTPQTMSYPVRANYTLVNIADGKIISASTAQATVSFDRDSQRYATIRAQRDAEIRAAKVLADQIKARLIGELARGQ